MLTILDEYTRECHVLRADRALKSADVLEWMGRAIAEHGAPGYLRSDNGPEFIAYAIQDWLEAKEVKAIYIQPGSPWENGHIESFHDKFRDECLNREIFGSLLEAIVLVEQWRIDYNTNRPHSSLRYQTPQEVADHWQTPLRASPCAASASTTKNINNRTELHF